MSVSTIEGRVWGASGALAGARCGCRARSVSCFSRQIWTGPRGSARSPAFCLRSQEGRKEVDIPELYGPAAFTVDTWLF